MARIYLDYNATAPLRPQARAAMIAAMDEVGNPSSVHQEGRAAKMIMERAREQVAVALGAQAADVVFTSGATEAAALCLGQQKLHCSHIEHEAISANCIVDQVVEDSGKVIVKSPENSTLQLANSETGIIQDLPDGVFASDMTQAFGKVPVAFDWSGAKMGMVSAHKLGGPKGIGALVLKKGTDIAAQLRGGGQEMGRRSGTENIIGIAGFGAAAEASARDLDAGVWRQVEKLRNILENAIAQSSNKTIFVGNAGVRLPNTACMITPGWKGETQVMQMDLAGFAVSAGSACSSGKVKSSRVLMAMGYSETDAACALRVSLGPTTTEEEVMAFVEKWTSAYEKFMARQGANL
jgi:cysteine desulfurase